MNALILAAGFGSRLMPLTQNQPKCMVECCGKKIIDYEIEALKEAGVNRIGVVGGYLFDKLKKYLSDKKILDFYYNENYVNTNMVNTFFCASNFLQECIRDKQDLIISYSDIVYSSNIAKQLKQAEGDFCIVVDLDWKKQWEKRFEDPLSDAETLKISAGRVIELGKKPREYKEIEGQYIGLFKFSYQFLEKILKEYEAMDREAIYDGCSFEKMYMTSFLQHLINRFDNAVAVFIQGGWSEVDCKKDLEIVNSLGIKNILGEDMNKNDTLLKEIQDTLFGMALVFKEICDRHNLRYYMVYGTLLGAVRHNDFVPWDDDMDFVMPRHDYEKFIQIAAQEIGELSNGHYAVRDFSLEGETYKKIWVRIDDKRTSFEQCREAVTSDGYIGGVWIDIQPLDGVFTSQKMQKIHTWIIDKLLILRWYTIFRDPKKSKTWINRFGLKIVHKILGGAFGHKLIHSIMKIKAYNNAKFVKHLAWGDKGILPQEVYGTPINLKIRNVEFCAPRDWHGYLTHFYGDYMTPKKDSGHYDSNEINLHRSYIPRLQQFGKARKVRDINS